MLPIWSNWESFLIETSVFWALFAHNKTSFKRIENLLQLKHDITYTKTNKQKKTQISTTNIAIKTIQRKEKISLKGTTQKTAGKKRTKKKTKNSH